MERSRSAELCEDGAGGPNGVGGDETDFSADDWAGRGSKQLGLRLRPKHVERLCQAAEMYGVRPTTLARMMVIRGVDAILEAELARKGQFLRER